MIGVLAMSHIGILRQLRPLNIARSTDSHRVDFRGGILHLMVTTLVFLGTTMFDQASLGPFSAPVDAKEVWEVFPHVPEQKAGGLTMRELSQSLTPGANIHNIP
jgi:hypothetical protein